MEATSFSEQATAARRDYFAGSNSGVVGQDVRDVGDVVEKFTGAPRVPGVTPRSGVVIVGVGPPSRSADFRGGVCYLDPVEPEPTRSRPEVVPFRVYRRTEHQRSFSGPG